MITITELQNNPVDLAEVKDLIKEYGNYLFNVLNLNEGKETFFKELKTFPEPNYVSPTGTFILAKKGNRIIGCAGIKKFDEESVEMKRMFVHPDFRGLGAAVQLCNHVLDWSRRSGYKKILLDTNKEMDDAVSLYRKIGFTEIPAYCKNENANPIFMSYVL